MCQLLCFDTPSFFIQVFSIKTNLDPGQQANSMFRYQLISYLGSRLFNLYGLFFLFYQILFFFIGKCNKQKGQCAGR